MVTSEHTHNNQVNGTVTDENGNTSDISGTVKQTTTSSVAVPYTHNYNAFTLSIEQIQSDGKAKVLRRFQQAELVRMWAWSSTKAANDKRFHRVIEEAAKWIHEGGLTNPLETVAPQ